MRNLKVYKKFNIDDFDQCANTKYKYRNMELWAKEYFFDIAVRNEKIIKNIVELVKKYQ